MNAKRLTLASLYLFAVLMVGCGSSGPGEGSATESAQASPVNYETMRDKVVLGLAKEFRASPQAGPPRYGICVRLGIRRALTHRQLDRLLAIYRRPGGPQLAAQALNALAAPVGRKCGGARYVPKLIEAAAALGGDYPLSRLGLAARRLGVTYGPYLGVSCGKPNSTSCDRIGLDLVLERDARAVTAWLGGRKLVLRTPGLHSGEAGRDWVGYLHRAGLQRPGSPFRIPSNEGSRVVWSGYPAVRLSVRLRISYPDETVVKGTLPDVVLSPGWG